jgi:hypothetical protein
VWVRWAAALGALGAVASLSANAAAAGISASVRALYGFGLGDSQTISVGGATSSSTDWNPYGLGVGLRGGVTLSSFYLGASFDYFASETTKLEGIEVSGGRTQWMANLGYEFGLSLLTLRPFIGIGYARTSIKSGQSGDESQDDFAFAPGAEVMVSLGFFNISGELRYSLANTDALIAGIGAGISF